jgi:hypothetical protein
LIVVTAVAADIDHGVDGGRAAEPLAARLIADPPLEARLRHGVERPVIELARHHQRQRARRGDHPIVARAAGFQHRYRRFGILGKPAGDRAAAGATAHHHKIECIRHAHPPKFFVVSFSRHCEERSDEAIHTLLCGPMDCFAEPVIGRRVAPTRWLAMTDKSKTL